MEVGRALCVDDNGVEGLASGEEEEEGKEGRSV
jgi:hypothetical protein